MSLSLPATVQVLERGWLSANSILLQDGPELTVVDSGYSTHAPQTVALIEKNRGLARVSKLLNTHLHSDHMGGNAAIQAAFGCAIHIPLGAAPLVEAWDETGLLLTPLGQQAAPFRATGTLNPGQEILMGKLAWQALAVPGHDPHALAFFSPDSGLLIAGDALWEDGFGLLFPTLLGEGDALQDVRQTLETLGRLPLRGVIPGHGRPFADCDGALQRAFSRLGALEASRERLAWHGLKVIIVFGMLERRSLSDTAFDAWVSTLPFVIDVNARYLNLAMDSLVSRLRGSLFESGALVHDSDQVRVP